MWVSLTHTHSLTLSLSADTSNCAQLLCYRPLSLPKAFSREFSMRALDMIQENLELDATHISVVAIQNGPTPDGPNDVLVRENQTKKNNPTGL